MHPQILKVILVHLICFPGGTGAGAPAPRTEPAPGRLTLPTEDGGTLSADLYGTGERGVVLAHGGRFNKESWEKQARVLEKAGFRVIAFDFRGYGQSKGPGQEDIYTAPLHLDVLAAVRHLRASGAKSV
jgi:pimeloyl-ACP methyl ester carboxylesterase